jgi:chromosome segregation ATPase
MIDIQLIDSAKEIRKKYLDALYEINLCEGDIKDLSEFLNKKLKSIENIQKFDLKEKPSESEFKRVLNLILKEIEEIEEKEIYMRNKINPLYEKIESLKRDEDILYDTIKERYPNLSDYEIKTYINQNLER